MSLEAILDIVKNFWPMLIRGAGVTLFISIIGTVLGTMIGLMVGIVNAIPLTERGIKRKILQIIKGIFAFYVEFFRGTPMIVQAMVIYYGSAQAFGIDMNRTFAAIFIVSINTGAYMSEIVRGGIISIDKGQFEAASAIGMNHFQTMINVVLPQVVRNILPATGNEFVINVKDTSVLNVIGITELYFQTKSIATNQFVFFEPFTVTCILYFVMTFSITRILRFIEKKIDGPENYTVIKNQMQVQRPEDALSKKA